jgi:predicted dehydrogenase
MIEAATKTGNLLTIFHQRRYAPDFVKVKEVIASGKLGRIVSIRMCSHYFTRRYDWQTVAALGGGELRNNASHPLDQAFQLIGEGEPELFCDLQKTVTFGDAEDHVKIVLKIPGTPVVDIEVSACQAFPQENWLVVGTQGSLTGTSQALRWKHFDPAQLPHREVDRGPAGSYPSDDIPWKEESWEIPADGKPDETIYYEELHKTLRGGAPLPVTPQSVRRVMWVIEECLRRHAPAQGY